MDTVDGPEASPLRPLCLIVAKLALGRVRGDEVVAAATDALEAGAQSPSLAVLAGLTDATLDEVSPWLTRVQGELGLPTPTRQLAAIQVACAYARDILAGTLSPSAGARAIWRDAFLEAQPDYDLAPFVADADSIDDALTYRVRDPSFYDGMIRAAEAGIRESAVELLRAYPGA